MPPGTGTQVAHCRGHLAKAQCPVCHLTQAPLLCLTTHPCTTVASQPCVPSSPHTSSQDLRADVIKMSGPDGGRGLPATHPLLQPGNLGQVYFIAKGIRLGLARVEWGGSPNRAFFLHSDRSELCTVLRVEGCEQDRWIIISALAENHP